jgi:MFS family permease
MTNAAAIAPTTGTGPAAVLRNRPFLLLWLAQAATQIGGNMVLFGLTLIVVDATGSSIAVSALILTFLVPAVLLSAVAGVYVDRLDRRLILVVTNVSRGIAIALIYFAGDNVLAILVLNTLVSTITVFFAPAEAAMIPVLVPRHQLLAANGIFTLTLNGAFALGFALAGPLVVTLFGANTLILIVAALYLIAAVFCWTLPSAAPTERSATRAFGLQAAVEAEHAVESTLAQLREGLDYIRGHRNITWSLIYLGIAASLVGVLGVLGPNFARENLGLKSKDFTVVVLPLGAGIVMGILLLNTYGKYLPRRRVIEVGLVGLGVLLALLGTSGPISRFLQSADRSSSLLDLSALTSLLAIVVVIAFFAGIAYGFVAIPSQTQLQEDLPEDVRGRVFGVLNMLVSVSSFLPILVAGFFSDKFGTTTVIFAVGIFIGLAGIASIVRRGPLQLAETRSTADAMVRPVRVDPIAVANPEPARAYERAHPGIPGPGGTPAVSRPDAAMTETVAAETPVRRSASGTPRRRHDDPKDD